MDNAKLSHTLNSIGKAFFVKYLKAAQADYTNATIAKAIVEETNYTLGSCQVRISKIRSILRAERARDALSIVVNSQVQADTRLSAIKQLHEHL
ncbi:MAG TPA: hypothetical protein DE179_12355 [Oceanospirillaceae bacterium]|nr:hypothetical protein [Oceanospirillaceae bacterium]